MRRSSSGCTGIWIVCGEWVGRSAGSVLRALRRLGGGGAFALLREDFCCSPPRLAADRSRSAGRIVGSAGSVLRSLRRLGGGGAFALLREDFCCSPPRLAADRSRSAGRIVGSAGSVLHSLRKLWGGLGFRAVARGFLLFASKARCGPIPLRWAYCGLRGIGPALAGNVGAG
jgi:hypothetical protein